MIGKRKLITVQKIVNIFSIEERHKIIKEYLSSGCTKREIFKKYTGKQEEHGEIIRWMRELGYLNKKPLRTTNFAKNINLVMQKKVDEKFPIDQFDFLQLKRRVEDLEKQLKEAEMKAIAYSTMVDIAEKEFNISIRKKLNTKPLKK